MWPSPCSNDQSKCRMVVVVVVVVEEPNCFSVLAELCWYTISP